MHLRNINGHITTKNTRNLEVKIIGKQQIQTTVITIHSQIKYIYMFKI